MIMKLPLFGAIIESVLLYGSETWAVNERMPIKIDRKYPKFLRYIDRRDPVSNHELYSNMPLVSSTVE